MQMKAGDYIKIRKLKATDAPIVPTPPFATYKQGEDNGPVSLPIEYTATGMLQFDAQVGEGLRILRDTRNGEQCTGAMQTSPVTKIEDGKVYTGNSIYEVEVLKPAFNPELN